MKLSYALFSSAALLATVGLVVFSRSAPVPFSQRTQPASGSVYSLTNGLRVQPLPLESNDVTQMLDMKMWKFNVTVPEPDRMLECGVHIRRGGKTVQTVAGIGTTPSLGKPTEVMVGLLPVDGSWQKSDKFKSLVRIGGGSGSSVQDNPFKGFVSYGSGSPELQPDGSFLLMVGSKGHSVRWPQEKENDLALALTFKSRPIASPK